MIKIKTMKDKKEKHVKHIFTIFASGEKDNKYKSIIRVKARFNDLDIQDKIITLEKMMEWTRQQLNALHQEQE